MSKAYQGWVFNGTILFCSAVLFWTSTAPIKGDQDERKVSAECRQCDTPKSLSEYFNTAQRRDMDLRAHAVRWPSGSLVDLAQRGYIGYTVHASVWHNGSLGLALQASESHHLSVLRSAQSACRTERGHGNMTRIHFLRGHVYRSAECFFSFFLNHSCLW